MESENAGSMAYNPGVRIGNWFEDLCLEEDNIKDFLLKKERGELLIQKTSNVKSTILAPVELSTSPDGYVHFGDIVVLRNEENPDRNAYFAGIAPRDTSLVAAAIGFEDLLKLTKLPSPCNVNGARGCEPCVRTAFTVSPVNPSTDTPGAALKYGQPFFLRTCEGAGGGLYLRSDSFTFQRCAAKSRYNKMDLTDRPTILCQWKCLYLNPQMRMEMEAFPVPANTKLIIQHGQTGNAIAAMEDTVLSTPFGKEYEVVCHTFLDSHRFENPINHYSLTMHVPGSITYSMEMKEDKGLQKARDILAERTEIAEQECQEHIQTHQLTEKLKKECSS